ncbi:SDR family NAD(P)-dependent oxidoreductase [Pseudonocardia sp. NPDC049154]|uniref:SDR family NAD(P)-dependent oxidoreductase n=1 Tax=Pseudonocardia sp. NPDC049154 TaxID=3155501 RepID=UPI0033D9B718
MRFGTGQVAVVTGAASGIGLSLARQLAERGLSVVLTDVRADVLESAAAGLRETGATAVGLPADVTDPESVAGLAKAPLELFGRVDLIANNAGVTGPTAPMWEQDLATWRWIVDVSLMGVVNGVHAFVPHMVERGSGHVLNTASMGGLIALPQRTPYNAAKHAVVGLTETLDVELKAVSAELGATVLCPGMVETDLHRTSLQNRPAGVGTTEETARPAGSALSPDEVAEAAMVGIEAGRVHVLSNPGSGPVARARVEALLADIDEPR